MDSKPPPLQMFAVSAPGLEPYTALELRQLDLLPDESGKELISTWQAPGTEDDLSGGVAFEGNLAIGIPGEPVAAQRQPRAAAPGRFSCRGLLRAAQESKPPALGALSHTRSGGVAAGDLPQIPAVSFGCCAERVAGRSATGWASRARGQI